ncbi:Uncharacterised protein [uncultured archaeon]|nr:Uncharacterised protein [uncultured archaeon]
MYIKHGFETTPQFNTFLPLSKRVLMNTSVKLGEDNLMSLPTIISLFVSILAYLAAIDLTISSFMSTG